MADGHTPHETIVSSHQELAELTKQRSGQSCLVKIYPPGSAGGLLTFPDKTFMIGRGTECNLDIEDSAVSRRHAAIEKGNNGAFIIIDLGSTNGTYVNDVRITRHELKDGDMVRIGSHIMKFLSSANIEAQFHETIYSMMVSDGLTGIHNRRFFLESLERELARSQRHRRPLALVVFDIDHFKSINDTHGHLAGDAVLRELAHRIQSAIRKDEVFARYGGEEFVVILPEATRDKAMIFADRLRGIIADRSFDVNSISINVTISLGVSCIMGEPDVNASTLIARADQNLYSAKQAGRNRVQG